MADEITFWKMAPVVISGLSFLIMIGGFLFTFGRLREQMKTFISKSEFDKACRDNQNQCGADVGEKLDKLKDLFISLHDKQTERIEKMDEKREDAKEASGRELTNMAVAIGKIEKHIEVMANKE